MVEESLLAKNSQSGHKIVAFSTLFGHHRPRAWTPMSKDRYRESYQILLRCYGMPEPANLCGHWLRKHWYILTTEFQTNHFLTNPPLTGCARAKSSIKDMWESEVLERGLQLQKKREWSKIRRLLNAYMSGFMIWTCYISKNDLPLIWITLLTWISLDFPSSHWILRVPQPDPRRSSMTVDFDKLLCISPCPAATLDFARLIPRQSRFCWSAFHNPLFFLLFFNPLNFIRRGRFWSRDVSPQPSMDQPPPPGFPNSVRAT